MRNPAVETASALIIDALPGYIKEEYPSFVDVLRIYFDDLEKTDQDGTAGFLRALLDFRKDVDIDSNTSPYIDETLKQLGYNTPAGLKITKAKFVHFLREHYLSRGSPESFRFLFKAFFNDEVAVSYPRLRLAASSVTSYGNETILYTTATNYGSPEFNQIVFTDANHASTLLEGEESLKVGVVERIKFIESRGERVLEVAVSVPVGFSDIEPVSFNLGDTSFTETILSVATLTVAPSDLSRNFAIGDSIRQDSSDAVFAGEFLVSKLESGTITGVTISTRGTGYQTGEAIYGKPTSFGAGFSAEIASVGATGGIASVRIINKGWGYREMPELFVDTVAGTSAVISGVSTNIGKINELVTVRPVLFKNTDNVVTLIPDAPIITSEYGTGAVLPLFKSTEYETEYELVSSINAVLGRECIITDSNFFQKFSYELKSRVSAEQHQPYSDTLHPVGYIRFNVYEIDSNPVIQLQDHTSSLVTSTF